MTPSTVQRDFQRIISKIGKPGHSPKPRGNSTGRVASQTQPKPDKHPAVKKKIEQAPRASCVIFLIIRLFYSVYFKTEVEKLHHYFYVRVNHTRTLIYWTLDKNYGLKS